MVYLDSAATAVGGVSFHFNANASYAYTEKRLIAELDERVKRVLGVSDGIVAWGQNTTQLVKMLDAKTGGFDTQGEYEHDCIDMYDDGLSFTYAHMLVNNITGDWFEDECRELGQNARVYNNFLLMDCTAAIGHVALPHDLADWCDVVVFSGHKFGGGFTGAMWMSQRFCDWYGAKSGDDVTGGTPDVEGRKRMVDALEHAQERVGLSAYNYHQLATKLWSDLYDVFGTGMKFIHNNDTRHKSYAINAIRLNGINADALQLFLASHGCYIGRGTSACDSSKAGYRVLTQAYGLTEQEASEVIRVSFAPNTTFEDIDELVRLIKEYKERFVDESKS